MWRRCRRGRLWRGTWRRGRGRLRRGPRRRRGSRRWRGSGRRRCRRRRCCSRRRGTRRWLGRGRRALRRRFGFSVGTKLFLGLRHNQRCGLRVRCRACELHCRQRSRGKQYEAKSCHDGWDPGKICNKLRRSTNKVGPDCGGLGKRTCFYSDHTRSQCVLVHCAFRRSFPTELSHCPPRPAMSGFRSGGEPGRSAIPSPVGEGAGGPCGPRTGNSSGLLPGSSSGRGGSPGSRCGGGTSGRGLPGGLSCGGSDGCPGLIGGSSCGSIGVSLIPNNGAARAMFL